MIDRTILGGRFHVHTYGSSPDRGRSTSMSVHRFDGREASGPTLFGARFERYRGSAARSSAGLGIRFYDEIGGLQAHLSIPRVWAGWLSIGSDAAFWPLARRHPRLSGIARLDIVDVAAHDGKIWWRAWVDPMGSTRGLPRWRYGHLAVVDWLCGPRMNDTETVVGPTVTLVPLPEDTYSVELSIERVTIRRRRFTRRRVLHRYDMSKVLSEPGYIPSPGNPESDFFDGADGTFSMSGPFDGLPTIPNAVGAIVSHVLTERARYGVAPDYAEQIR